MKSIRKKDLRIFGFIWGFIFSFIFYINTGYIANIFMVLSILIVAIAWLFPKKLTFLYKKWVIVGGYIGKVNSIIILLLLFIFIITPTSLIFKILRKDLLNKKVDLKCKSYWIDREEQPGSMINQF